VRGSLITTICIAALAAGCGDGDDDNAGGATVRTQVLTELPSGCEPDRAVTLLTGFIDAINSGDEEAAVRYVASQPEIFRLTLYTGPRPGEGRIDVDTPAEAYEGMGELAGGEEFTLLEVAVGTAPRADRRSGPRTDDPIAGVDFVYESERRSISGKVGYNCATGQVYSGAMTVGPLRRG
jgi:hypothetical protein